MVREIQNDDIVINETNPELPYIKSKSSKDLFKIASIFQDELGKIEYFQTHFNKYSGENDIDYEWDYKKPSSFYGLIDEIVLSKDAQSRLFLSSKKIGKGYVHKNHDENVMLSEPERFGNLFGFKVFPDLEELNSDHKSDHIDGIKLFEAIRQATLASSHLVGLKFDTATALMQTKIDYIKFVESNIPFLVEIIPFCKVDGGAMFTVFSIIQNGEIVMKGYMGAYVFRSKEQFFSKREDMKIEAQKKQVRMNF
ncbi:AfsA-related hotdog domain-containing protein [Companilactobacillus metriopterae]|uniref:AfsA-related hotdog domain-containing protein n=1 Tax=Companilactobacillus metriopterae TaxID=1909267 RepID=UPI00100B1B0F|nr:AfsA-related hotdog domain-containing protein [Companilactobacillus metriopterae]